MKKQILLAALAASITLFGASAVSAAEPVSPPAPTNAGGSDIVTPPSRSYMDSLIRADRRKAEQMRQDRPEIGPDARQPASERPGRGPAPGPERRYRHGRHPAPPPPEAFHRGPRPVADADAQASVQPGSRPGPHHGRRPAPPPEGFRDGNRPDRGPETQAAATARPDREVRDNDRRPVPPPKPAYRGDHRRGYHYRGDHRRHRGEHGWYDGAQYDERYDDGWYDEDGNYHPRRGHHHRK